MYIGLIVYSLDPGVVDHSSTMATKWDPFSRCSRNKSGYFETEMSRPNTLLPRQNYRQKSYHTSSSTHHTRNNYIMLGPDIYRWPLKIYTLET